MGWRFLSSFYLFILIFTFVNLFKMSLISSAPFSSVTTYRKDFYRKNCPRPPKFYPVQEYPNPLAGPLEEHILPNFKYQQLPKCQTKYPDPKQYAEHMAETYPSTRNYLKDPPGGPPDLDVIDKFYEDENRTVYMISYCTKGDYDSKQNRGKKPQPLPEDWVVPLTTQKCSYRNPRLIAKDGFEKIIVSVPKDNLSPNEREREILEVKTGDSIYISDISNTGMEIIKGKLHGDVEKRPQFDQGDLIKAMMIRTD